MPQADHRLERRSSLLAARLRERTQAIRDAVAPAGQRLPFHARMSAPEALAWWSTHRYDDLGQQVLGQWSPDQIASLDNALIQHQETQALAPAGFGPPTLGDGTSPSPAA